MWSVLWKALLKCKWRFVLSYVAFKVKFAVTKRRMPIAEDVFCRTLEELEELGFVERR